MGSAIWLEELVTLPDATRKRAQALVAKGITIELFVRREKFPRPPAPWLRSIPARCDCIDGTLCEHVVLAVQASSRPKLSKRNLLI